jgi:hypothetical protein
MLLLAYYMDRPTVVLAGILGVLTAAASLTRFFALFWLAPLIFAFLLVLQKPSSSWRRRVTPVVAFAVPLLLFVLPWLVHLKRKTGFVFGKDRFATRQFAPENADWNELTGFTTNVHFALKTTFVDLFSPIRTASHEVVNRLRLTQSEVLVLLAVLVLAVLATVVLVQEFRKLPRSSRLTVAITRLTSPQLLPFLYAIVYLVALVALWTVGNNDPIYTRFMYPSYPFVILALLAHFAWMKDRGSTAWQLLPLYLLGALFVTTNLAYFVVQFTGS